MQLSIIIPNLNDAVYLERLLTFLLTHPIPSSEIIVVDGGSEDDSCNIVKQMKCHLVESEPSRAIQMNTGEKVAQGKYLCFLHADTLPPNTFTQDFELFRKGAKKAACYRSKFENGPFMLGLNAFFTRFSWLVSRGGDQGLFIEKEYFNQLGRFPEQMQVMEEYPLLEKILKDNELFIFKNGMNICTRKYENRSWLRVSRANYVAFKLYQQGADSVEIKRRYLEILA